MGLSLWLIVWCSLFLVSVSQTWGFPFYTNGSEEWSTQLLCPDMGDIEFATVKAVNSGHRVQTVHVECAYGYELVGGHKLLCSDGAWEPDSRPKCVPLCDAPPALENGKLSLEGDKNGAGMFKKGTLVTYSCDPGFELTPADSRYRVCEKGIWTGASASCVPYEQLSGCKPPRDLVNGYFVQERNAVSDGFTVGQRVHYSCKPGFTLSGSPVQQCLDDGSWSPKIAPICMPHMSDSVLQQCLPLPPVKYAVEKVLKGQKTPFGAIAGTEVAIRCMDGYRNAFSSFCQAVLFQCSEGVWNRQSVPNCVPVKGCPPPPSVTHGAAFNREAEMSGGRLARYPVGADVTYQCFPGYELRGSRVLRCSAGGCWEPFVRPSCQPDAPLIDEYGSGTVLVSLATAAVVMLLLLCMCAAVMCRRRKLCGRPPLTQGVSAAGPHSAAAGAAATALAHDPDRLALIAFADGLHVGQQSGLPTYEEAIRDRVGGPGCASGFLSARPHRPHWPTLGTARRGRAPAGQQPELYVTRQGSSASHSASMRSGSAGDPMGSTDTMTPSEVSTNITLDTVSSHSGSHPPSCRAICGSLASFDTSSVVNTEGAPLLEENEAEESINAETESLGLDHRSMADNASFKYRRTSPDLA